MSLRSALKRTVSSLSLRVFRPEEPKPETTKKLERLFPTSPTPVFGKRRSQNKLAVPKMTMSATIDGETYTKTVEVTHDPTLGPVVGPVIFPEKREIVRIGDSYAEMITEAGPAMTPEEVERLQTAIESHKSKTLAPMQIESAIYPPEHERVDLATYEDDRIVETATIAEEPVSPIEPGNVFDMTPVPPTTDVPEPGFTVGQLVTWTSNGATKHGTITHIVPIGSVPGDLGVTVKDANKPRDHESYIISAVTPEGRTRPYWPKVAVLELGV